MFTFLGGHSPVLADSHFLTTGSPPLRKSGRKSKMLTAQNHGRAKNPAIKYLLAVVRASNAIIKSPSQVLTGGAPNPAILPDRSIGGDRCRSGITR